MAGLEQIGKTTLNGTNNKIGCKYSRNFRLGDKEMEIKREEDSRKNRVIGMSKLNKLRQ